MLLLNFQPWSTTVVNVFIQGDDLTHINVLDRFRAERSEEVLNVFHDIEDILFYFSHACRYEYKTHAVVQQNHFQLL